MSGDVEATGIAGDSRWASASGDLRLAVDGGRVQLETMSGRRHRSRRPASIALGARTVSGDLRVRAPRLLAIDAGTTSGDVRIEGDARRRVHPRDQLGLAATSRSSRPSPVRLQAQTIAGDVRASGKHVTERGSAAAGRWSWATARSAIGVRTTSGDVRLRALDRGVGRRSEPPAAVPRRQCARRARSARRAGRVPVRPGAARRPEPFAVALGLAARARAAVDAEEDTQAWSRRRARRRPPRGGDRLEVLRALERGDLDIETAAARLEVLERGRPALLPGVVLMAADPLDQVLRLVAEGAPHGRGGRADPRRARRARAADPAPAPAPALAGPSRRGLRPRPAARSAARPDAAGPGDRADRVHPARGP